MTELVIKNPLARFYSNMDRFPSRKDPRIPFFFILLTYVLVGVTFLGFNRSPGQILIIVMTTCILDMAFSALFRKKIVFPLSAAITGMGLSILVNTAHGLWLPALPAFFAIASKYLITVNGRHLYNPNLFGLLVAVILGEGMISPSPAYQWGGYTAISFFVVTAALSLFVFKINRNALIISFLIFYSINIFIRGWLTQHHVPAETIILGTITSPAFYLFTFFMITDPATSPNSKSGQIFMAFFISFVDLILHKFEALSTLFKAAFLFYTLMFVYRAFQAYRQQPLNFLKQIKSYWMRPVTIGVVGLIGISIYQAAHTFNLQKAPDFSFEKISTEGAGIESQPSNILQEVDPRIKHLSKWIMAQGDGVSIADVNNDGLPDLFVSYSLKQESARSALYLNKGNFNFQRHPLPAIDEFIKNFKEEGLAATGLFFDYDNDGDQDLYLATGFGYPRFLHNNLIEKGYLEFIDNTELLNLRDYTTSMSANVADLNQDGRLDLIVGNSLRTQLANYEQAPNFSIFDLPAAEHEGDRRAFDFMHRTWHNANNGGENIIYLSGDDGFSKQSNEAWGFSGTRWTLDVGVGDLNNDGWPDIYLANDFGPDQMFINQEGYRFKTIEGKLVGELGRDTYKGMNSTIADFNNDGNQDVYVSNVHVALQAEGSLLWINDGTVNETGYKAFTDSAMAMNALNENRFGWGAAAVDINRDGRLDILQANGMVNDNYDEQYEGCPDYWYWNEKVALTGPEVHGFADSYADLRGRCIYPHDKKRAYINEGQYFVDVADQVGWSDTEVARGIAVADMDNDGDMDVLVSQPFAPLAIYKNQSAAKSWVGVKLVGNGYSCNRDAIGSRVELIYGSETELPMQMREVVASNGLLSQSERRLMFGLDDYQGNVKLKINWCGQGETAIVDIKTNQYNVIRQVK
ncbi:FG-GAP-like repeat-containing protein [Pleionea sediminis]|uniref:FG-GAP-like repeat-containing protein n=1 Tax=Pleionea sediminis TaxID=2569479 RepID=UPI001186B3A0|nr:FG-GAP-like repeat-containing protein [Pleionea sediminis]